MTQENLDNAYQQAIKFASSHYENFPVVSKTLSASVRKHIAVIYQFARQADDLADEGDTNPQERIRNLELYEKNLSDCLRGVYTSPFWLALRNTISEYSLDVKNLYDLLSAFKQDVIQLRYKDFNQLLDYCSRSANPVGRIILDLHRVKTSEAVLASDAVCTALQLTNFYQDVSVDFKKGRIYIPTDEMEKFGADEKIFESKENNIMFKRLMKYQVERTGRMFAEGKKILTSLPGSLRIQIRMTILGGEKILSKIVDLDYNVLNVRPALTKPDYFKIFMKALF